jgi:hypothetical protein
MSLDILKDKLKILIYYKTRLEYMSLDIIKQKN